MYWTRGVGRWGCVEDKEALGEVGGTTGVEDGWEPKDWGHRRRQTWRQAQVTQTFHGQYGGQGGDTRAQVKVKKPRGGEGANLTGTP